MRTADLARFWTRVSKGEGDECWMWNGDSQGPHRYGRLKVDGRRQYAHRLSWEIANGPIPARLHVLHRCDTPRCVRPSHLFLGTHLDNVLDMRKKGRGSDPPRARPRNRPACPAGHRYTPENTYVHPAGYKVCRTCSRNHGQAYNERRKSRPA